MVKVNATEHNWGRWLRAGMIRSCSSAVMSCTAAPVDSSSLHSPRSLLTGVCRSGVKIQGRASNSDALLCSKPLNDLPAMG